ncbi:hypothetical protein ABH926_004399 [Catenulispora sp. GP43]|uniref:hypothetical protein n=1 Tax=Catenulispora sp. GP43 TaxID=3156263 RepID=UPI0035126E63
MSDMEVRTETGLAAGDAGDASDAGLVSAGEGGGGQAAARLAGQLAAQPAAEPEGWPAQPATEPVAQLAAQPGARPAAQPAAESGGQSSVQLPARVRWATTGAAALLVALGTAAQWWFVPFFTGIAFGALGSFRGVRPRTGVWCAAAAGSLGWTVPLVWRAIAGQPVVATARVASALAGLPPTGWVVIILTLLVAALQGILGAWLARSVSGPFFRRRARVLAR